MKIEDIDKTWDLFSEYGNAKNKLETVKLIKDMDRLMEFIQHNKYDIKLPEIEQLKKSVIVEIDKSIKELENQIKAI